MDAPTITEECQMDLAVQTDDWSDRVVTWARRIGPIAYRIAASAPVSPDLSLLKLLRWSPEAVVTLAARTDLPEPLLSAMSDDWLASAIGGEAGAISIICSVVQHRSIRPGHPAFAALWRSATRKGTGERQNNSVFMVLECPYLSDEHLGDLIRSGESLPQELLLKALQHKSADASTWQAMARTTFDDRAADRMTEIERCRRLPRVILAIRRQVSSGSVSPAMGRRLWVDAPPSRFADGIRWLLNPVAATPHSTYAPKSIVLDESRIYDQVDRLEDFAPEIAWLLNHADETALSGLAMEEIIALTSARHASVREAAYLACGRYPDSV